MPNGMGGMGGGLMGGLLRNMTGSRSDGAAEVQTAATNVYDVDRWKRADGLDNMTAVQAVRRSWEERQAEAKKQTLGQKLKALFKKDAKRQTAEGLTAAAPEDSFAGGTVAVSEIKELPRRIRTDSEQKPGLFKAAPAEQAGRQEKNYLDLEFPTALEGFFTENPVNSAILAVDRLGFGPLSMNQVTAAPEKLRKAAELENAHIPPAEIEGKTALHERKEQPYKVRVVE